MGVEVLHLEFAASGGYLAVSSSPALLEEYLRSGEGGGGRALREDAVIREAAAKVGGMSTGLLGYQNQRIATRVQWDFIRGGGIEKLTGGMAPKWAEALNFNLLPEFERVARYFGIAVYTGSADAQGLNLRFYGPSPQ
jgi:hypothetical protein